MRALVMFLLLLLGVVGAGWLARLWLPAPAARDLIMHELPGASLRIMKQERKLLLLDGGRVIAEYRIALGREPRGPKQRDGDGRTPEGRYRVCVKNPASKFTLSLGLNYPNAEDAECGRAAGLISPAEHEAILNAARTGEQPPWDTALGGEIFIHGRGAHADWTQGCIAVEDGDIRELYARVPLGAPVEILP